MSMNLSALNMFRSALDWNNKGVANLDHKYAVLNDHEYGGWLSSIGRNDDEKEDNNRVRAELLRALGLAFKLKGMSEDGLIDEIGPKAFREYFRVDPRGAKA